MSAIARSAQRAGTPPTRRLPPGRDTVARDDIAVAAFVETFGATLTAAGMQRLVSRVVALMLTDDDGRMTAAEIGTALRVSPAAVSGAMSFLHGYGFVTKECQPGSRRDVYVLQTDTWHDVTLQKAAMIGHLVDQITGGIDAVGGPDTPAGRRLAYSAEFYRFIAGEMDKMITGWDQRRSELKQRSPA